jgi:hypothetical protein
VFAQLCPNWPKKGLRGYKRGIQCPICAGTKRVFAPSNLIALLVRRFRRERGHYPLEARFAAKRFELGRFRVARTLRLQKLRTRPTIRGVRYLRFCSLALCLVFDGNVVSAANAPSDEEARRTAVEWVALLDSGAYLKAYRQQPPRILSYGHSDQWLSWMRSRRGPLGRSRSRAFFKVTHSHTLTGAPDGNYELVAFKTSFQRKAQCVELVVLTSETGRWQVSGYKVY